MPCTKCKYPATGMDTEFFRLVPLFQSLVSEPPNRDSGHALSKKKKPLGGRFRFASVSGRAGKTCRRGTLPDGRHMSVHGGGGGGRVRTGCRYVCSSWSCTASHWRDSSASSEGYSRVGSVLLCRDFWSLLSAVGFGEGLNAPICSDAICRLPLRAQYNLPRRSSKHIRP